MENNIVNNNLSLLKEENNLRISDMARIANIPPSTMANYLKDREPGYDALISFSRYFNVTIDWLLGESDVRNETEREDIKSIESSSQTDDSDLLSEHHLEYSDMLMYYLSRILRNFRTMAQHNQDDSFADGLYFYEEIIGTLEVLDNYLQNINQDVYDTHIETLDDIEKFLRKQNTCIEYISLGLKDHSIELIQKCISKMSIPQSEKALLLRFYKKSDNRRRKPPYRI